MVKIDFAGAARAERWLRHPVLGDPSFDGFQRAPVPLVHRGAPPFSWPVNVFLFRDPRTGARYAYIGEYGEGYVRPASRCRLYRQNTTGAWDDLGVVLQGDPALFDKNGHTPDVSVVFADGRYHMVYDWGELDFNAEGGLAYAVADRPEGPWQRAPQPLTRNTTLPLLLGRYRRTYAATLLRRRRDWLVLGMLDRPPFGWTLFGMTAAQPDGPYSERRLLLHPEQERFHPGLLEFYPAFVAEGFAYAPATSVALNRNFGCLFRAPLEDAHRPESWELVRHGSLWHAADSEAEHFGLWGQTFSGQVDGATLHVLFPSRDPRGIGTISQASRPWRTPLRTAGFVLSGHQGASLTLLRTAWKAPKMTLTYTLRGTAALLAGWTGALGPNQPQADSTLHPKAALALSRISLEPGTRTLQLSSLPDGILGLWVGPSSHLTVTRCVVEGTELPATLTWLWTEALLGHAENPAEWEPPADPTLFRFGEGVLSRQPGSRVKWNVVARRLRLWSPRGPEFGTIELRLDGKVAATIDLHAPQPVPSAIIWESDPLPEKPHALIVEARSGRMPVDSLESVRSG